MSVRPVRSPLRLIKSSILIALVLFAFGAPSFADLPLPPRTVVNNPEEAIKLAGPDFYPVKGTGSMKPYIPESDDPSKVVALLAVDKPPYEHLKKGDLVIFRSNGRQVVHQIAASQGEKWITTGIDNEDYDGPALNRETFISRVLHVYVLGQENPSWIKPKEDIEASKIESEKPSKTTDRHSSDNRIRRE